MYIFLDSTSIPLLRLDVERGNCPAIYTYISRVRMPMHLSEVLLITPTLNKLNNARLKAHKLDIVTNHAVVC